MSKYYVTDPITGASRTREFVEAFIKNWANPEDFSRSIYDTIYGLTSHGLQNTYLVDNAGLDKKPGREGFSSAQVVGRANGSNSFRNPDEELWCKAADVCQANKQIDLYDTTKLFRKILMLRYVYDWQDRSIADFLHISEKSISIHVDKAFEILTKILDHEHID